MLKKLLKLFVVVFILTQEIFVTTEMQVQAKKDAVLEEYKKNFLPENAEEIDSYVYSNIIIIDGNEIKERPVNTQYNGEAYTYCIEENGKSAFYGLFDIYSIEPLKVSKNDRIEILLNDYFLPYGNVEPVLYGKNSVEGKWERITNITADNTGNKYVLHGIQMKSSYKYFRAIAHFTFSHNEEVPLAEPVYQINYYKQEANYFVPFLIAGVARVVIAVGMVYYIKKRRKA